jgi:hypothetical protein
LYGGTADKGEKIALGWTERFVAAGRRVSVVAKSDFEKNVGYFVIAR